MWSHARPWWNRNFDGGGGDPSSSSSEVWQGGVRWGDAQWGDGGGAGGPRSSGSLRWNKKISQMMEAMGGRRPQRRRKQGPAVSQGQTVANGEGGYMMLDGHWIDLSQGCAAITWYNRRSTSREAPEDVCGRTKAPIASSNRCHAIRSGQRSIQQVFASSDGRFGTPGAGFV